jgi:ABC-type multidrug transport system fused ATPase/permease subunit
MLQTFRKLQNLLDARERRNALLVFAMMLLLGLLEAAGVASVMPFVAVVMHPNFIHSNAYLAMLYEWLAFSDVNKFLLLLAAVIFVIVVGRIAFAALTQYAILRYSNALSYSLTTRLLETYLRQPYVWFLHRHSSDLGRSVLSEVEEVISGSVLPALQLTSRAIVTISIMAVLVAMSPTIAISIVLVLGGGYAATYYFVHSHLRRHGRERISLNRERFQIASDVLSGIKEVKVNGLEIAYLKRFRAKAEGFARKRTASKVIAQLPQYVFEGLALGGMLIAIMIILLFSQGSISRVLPIVGLYAFAGLRVLPALQTIYSNLTNMNFHQPALKAVHKDLAMAATEPALSPRDVVPWPLAERLELHEVTYTYPQSHRPALVEITLSIPARTTVGFVGATGAGKSTLVDVILGLLEPQKGEILIDGRPLGRENIRAWQRAIGYVPQHNFLVNDTVAANIAFGVSPEKIEMPAVELASRYAELHEFVENELPQGYNTVIGERGVRLSGGQRQRIAIARALYNDPDVLVLDEATSALDNLTEKAIMDALRNLSHVKTILLIAHRLSTVRACDRIFLLAHGRLKSTGTFEELLAHDGNFKKLASATG